MANWVRSFLEEHPWYNSLAIHKRAKNSIHFKREDGLIEAHFTGRPIHYEASPGDWRALDTDLIDLGNGYWGANGLIVRINKSDRTVEIVGTGYSQRTARVAILRPSTMNLIGTPLNIPVGTISGDSALALGNVGGANWEHRLCLTETGIRETLTLDSKPTIDGTLGTDYLVLETIISGVTFTDGEVGATDIEGHHFPLPTCTDADNNEAPTRRIAKTVSGEQRLYTGIPLSWMANSVYPIVIDPDFSTSTTAGFIWGSSDTYSTARSTFTAYQTNGAFLQVGQTRVSTVRTCYRSFMEFDTSSVGASTALAQVNLKLVCDTDQSTTDFDINIVKANWSGALGSNQEADYDLALSSSEDSGSPWRNTSGMSVNTQYSSPNLSTAWIQKTGTTRYALVSNRDYDSSGTDPSTSELVYLCNVLHSTEAYRPVLVVLYSTVYQKTANACAVIRTKYLYAGPSGSDSNTGFTWATRKLTLNGVEDIPVVAGDTVYIGPGVYRETLTVDVSGTAGNLITYIGDVTGEHTDGVGGIVRITGSDDDETTSRTNGIYAYTKNYRTYRGFCFDTQSEKGIDIGSVTNTIIEDCVFNDTNDGIFFDGYNTTTIIRRCLFIDLVQSAIGSWSGTVLDADVLIENCVALGMIRFLYSEKIGGITVKNCYARVGWRAMETAATLTGGSHIHVYNSIFAQFNDGFVSTAAGELVEDYNLFSHIDTLRTNVTAGGNSVEYEVTENTPAPLVYTQQLINWLPGMASQWSAYRAITGASGTGTDLFGYPRSSVEAKKSWGPIQYRPVERSSSTTYASSAASLKLSDKSSVQIKIPITAAASGTVSVKVYREADYTGTNPQMRINQPVNGYEGTTTDAGSASTWNTLTDTQTFTLNPPYILVELISNNTATSGSYAVYFDNLGFE